MTGYNEGSLVSCYLDAASFLLMFVLLVLSGHIFKNKSSSIKLFRSLCMAVAITCVACFFFNAMRGHTSNLSHTVALISRTIWDFMAITVNCMWIAYIEQKLFSDFEPWKNKRTTLICIVIATAVLYITNIFNGMVFTIAEDNSLVPKTLFYVIFISNFLLFLSSILEALRYDRITEKTRFIQVLPMFICVLLAVLPQFFTPYNTGIAGYVLGVTLVYFSIISRNYYMDEESGLYSKKFLNTHLSKAVREKKSARSAMLLETHGNQTEVFRILHETLHKKGDVIRYEKNRFLMFLKGDTILSMQYLSSLVDEAVAEYNEKNPEDKIEMKIRSIVRGENEDPLEFMRKALDENAAGNEVKGIASMISELDRLDKELSMAANIQKGILPMNFPPFPDRDEFELYASMTPAKEVGGDFYDFFLIDDDHLALVIADVSDKGVPAALFMMVSKTLIKNNLMSGLSPSKALEGANQQLFEHNDSMMFVTVWMAVIELSTGKGIACNAGHERPAFRKRDGSFEIINYEHDLVVGITDDITFNQREFEMTPGDTLLVYTDGVPEATNINGQPFGEEALLKALNKEADASPEKLICNLKDDIDEFSKDAKQFDDITILCLKYNGAK